MREIILAINNEYFIKKINSKKINYNNLQYREAILETLEKNKNINNIILDEKIPGQISIEKLIEKIIRINKNVNIIFFLEKYDDKKFIKLKKLGVKKIYINNKINVNKVINNLSEGATNNKVITIEGMPKSGKTLFTNLLAKYLNENNKKIVLINLNNNIERNYLKQLGSKKNSKNRYSEKEEIFLDGLNKNEININDNILFINNFQMLIKNNTKEKLQIFLNKYKLIYDYILIDIGNKNIKYVKRQILSNSNKKVLIINSKKLSDINSRKFEVNKKDDYYIICNNYNLLSVNKLIIKNIIGEKYFYSIISYNKKYKNITKKFYDDKNFKLKLNLRKNLKKVLKN